MGGSQPQRIVLRSKHQLWGAVAFGVLVAVFGIFGALQAGYLAAEVTEAAVAIACGAIIIGMTVRAAVVVDADGVAIRNPFGRTTRIRWSDIASFKIGRYKLLHAVCLVELAHGTVSHAWAIQVPNYARRPAGTAESQMVNRLNQQLASREARSPARHGGGHWRADRRRSLRAARVYIGTRGQATVSRVGSEQAGGLRRPRALRQLPRPPFLLARCLAR